MITQEEIKEYLHLLKDADTRDDRKFHDAVSQGVALLQLMDKDIAHEFGVSRPTVTRWRNGANAPHPVMRKHVYDLLERRARALLKRAPVESETVSPSAERSQSEAAPVVPLAARGRAVY